MSVPLDLSVVIPLRWDGHQPLEEMTAYLRELAGWVHEVVVVDGSAPPSFAEHARAWRGPGLRHLRPAPHAACANGKVAGVRTGVVEAARDKVVIADDDIRYTQSALLRVAAELDRAHLVRPQNYFDPLPWHAVWDTGRILVNRATGHDYPGTFGLRRSALLGVGGYDGNTLFENLELIRTMCAAGCVESRLPGLYVKRLPPDSARFWSQRSRQAYDDTAQPARMALFLSVLPLLGLAARRAPAAIPVGAAAVVLLAEAGRRRSGGRSVFPARTSLMAPVWVLERAVCVWPALAAWITRTGVPYAGSRLTVAAHSRRSLGRRAHGAPVLRFPGSGETYAPVGSVAEGPDGGRPAAAQRHRSPAGRYGSPVDGE